MRRDKFSNSSVNRKSKGKSKTKEEDSPAPESEIFSEWPGFANNYDIILTTFTVLQQDLGVARAPVIRPRRATVLGSYSDELKKVRSPLVTVEWARVIMDEVQLFGGRAAEMMSLIPRVHSLAVSGTPAKTSVGDLLQVLR